MRTVLTLIAVLCLTHCATWDIWKPVPEKKAAHIWEPVPEKEAAENRQWFRNKYYDDDLTRRITRKMNQP